MARGKAVVATATEGAKQLLGSNGVLVPVKDPVSMSESIAILLSDSHRMASIGERLQAIALDRYSTARMIDETEKLYLTLTAERE